jgi:phosphocarrier protein
MIIEKFEVLNELGLHARVASRIVREARKFKSTIIAKKEGKDYDLGNVTGVITVNAKHGDILDIEINGEDENEAAEAFKLLFLNKFGEK